MGVARLTAISGGAIKTNHAVVSSPQSFTPISLNFRLSICSKMVLLVTSDNEQFVTDKDIVERSVLIKNMLEGATHCISKIDFRHSLLSI